VLLRTPPEPAGAGTPAPARGPVDRAVRAPSGPYPQNRPPGSGAVVVLPEALARLTAPSFSRPVGRAAIAAPPFTPAGTAGALRADLRETPPVP
ncbi:hypothetical protein ACFV0P_35015, partial [Streptomyces atroolivaceus]